ncbi:uncharacterized protein LOC107420611 [Ziziphus jujuba]|uniref:Uncharacterized protein LOC107420611 n=2 Tax=Ziziphus jujuba TaxID=326968 RepID=A0A6P3ZY37_ZIZJJ|nr:uncharacterized protein LOC107420611 [Ziziphus jujuba]KAH7523775.1 hypothetical protein FEM48_Zijuj06G0047900 [Ziziphus jujuba var. spinosa]
MALSIPASVSLPPSPAPKFPIKVFKQKPWQFQRYQRPCIHKEALSTCCMKVSMSEFGEPSKVKLQIGTVKEKLWEAIPNSVKDLDRKKAVDILVGRLLFLGQKALKWSLMVYLITSSLSDFLFSISRNQELMIPFGLFVGCLIADLLNETCQQVFKFNPSEEKELDWHFIGISCLFVVVKFMSTYLGIRGQVFFLHVANGGLMQIVWLWKSLLKHIDNGENSASVQDT